MAETASSGVRAGDSDRTQPSPSQNLPTDGPASLGSTDGGDGFPWFFALFVVVLLAPGVLAVLVRLIEALETKWSQPPPDRPQPE